MVHWISPGGIPGVEKDSHKDTALREEVVYDIYGRPVCFLFFFLFCVLSIVANTLAWRFVGGFGIKGNRKRRFNHGQAIHL